MLKAVEFQAKIQNGLIQIPMSTNKTSVEMILK
ncbi:hypothetical protein NUACC26_070160 [Scytonema sp. NUACC26]